MLPYQLKALGCELHPASLQLLEGLCTQVRYATRRVACGVLWCGVIWWCLLMPLRPPGGELLYAPGMGKGGGAAPRLKYLSCS